MTWSLVEIRSLAVKAARGAGLSWGLAEEAGFAVIWLEGRGLSGVEALAGYLEELDRYSTTECPIANGAAITDRGEWNGVFPRELMQPLLVVPFVASILEDESLVIEWDSKAAVFNATGISGDISADLLSSGVHSVSVREGVVSTPNSFFPTRVLDNREPFVRILEKFAHRTYAPATEESRLAGAGAGLSDND